MVRLLQFSKQLECGPMPNVMAALPNNANNFTLITQSSSDRQRLGSNNSKHKVPLIMGLILLQPRISNIFRVRALEAQLKLHLKLKHKRSTKMRQLYSQAKCFLHCSSLYPELCSCSHSTMLCCISTHRRHLPTYLVWSLLPSSLELCHQCL